MNRIYQGRVSKVEILVGKNADGLPLENWQSVHFLSASNEERIKVRCRNSFAMNFQLSTINFPGSTTNCFRTR